MNSVQKMINLLTICRRAGRLTIGFDAVSDAVKNKKAFCVMTASDISANTLKEISFVCSKYNVKIIPARLTKEELEFYLGKTTAVIAVCDRGFADSFTALAEKL
ncbi:MAG: L7Ae/L30e/S12e/Gadd45 family ribosomal protein [Ruminococcus sp.]